MAYIGCVQAVVKGNGPHGKKRNARYLLQDVLHVIMTKTNVPIPFSRCAPMLAEVNNPLNSQRCANCLREAIAYLFIVLQRVERLDGGRKLEAPWSTRHLRL